VVSRRAKRLLQTPDESEEEKPASKSGFAYPPGLLVIDGGVPQVNAARRALIDVGLDIPVCGLAKRLEEIWLPDADYPVILPRSSEALFMLQRVRDEAHRVAIQYQRSTRKRSLRSELVDIPGVGDSMAQALLKTFGSVAAVRNAEVDQLRRVPGIGPALAERIYSSLHSGAKAP